MASLPTEEDYVVMFKWDMVEIADAIREVLGTDEPINKFEIADIIRKRMQPKPG